jgi:hypothetical protein
MKKLANMASTVLMVLALALAVGCSGVEGSGTAGSESRSVGTFTAIEVHGILRLEVLAGRSPALEVSGDDNLLSLVEAKVEGDRLVVRTTEEVRPKLPLVAKVSAEAIRAIAAHGASEVDARDLKGESFELDLHGASDAELGGEVDQLDVRVSGAAKVDAKGLKTGKAVVKVSGAGDVDVAEPDELDVSVSGAGNVTYGGSPKVTKTISGAGSVDKR